MKLLCVVLLFTCLTAMGTALGTGCQADWECKLAHGDACFCLKGQYGLLGQCKCDMDPNYLNQCTVDSDCKYQEHNQQVRTICKCRRDSPVQAKGRCKCDPALLG